MMATTPATAAMAAAAVVTQPTFVYPSRWVDSFTYWRTSGHKSASALSEERVVRRGLDHVGIRLEGGLPELATTMPVQTDPSNRVARFKQIKLSGIDDHRYLNVLEIFHEGVTEVRPNHAIIVGHGYGNGLGFWFQNYDAMSSIPGVRVYFIDWLGMGRSGRPHFPHIKVKGDPHSSKAVKDRVTQAEEFFTSSLEEFRQHEKLESMTLVGHSLGGYLSTAYALQHPDRVHKLVLVSPVGIPEAPYELPNVEEEAEDIEAIAKAEFESTREEVEASVGENGVRAKAPKTWWSRLWEANVSPFSVIRASTFLGPSLVSRYASRRFAIFPNDVQADLFSYLFQICRERGSGEYSLAHLLAPGAYARYPLIRRLPKLDIPMTFIYGDHDWMDEAGGQAVVELLKSKPETVNNRNQKLRSKVVINPHSGHWVHLENPKSFDKIIKRELKDAMTDLPSLT